VIRRWLAGQFARPHGAAGRLLVGPWLDRISRRMNALVLAELDPRPGETALEIGFGGGGLIAGLIEAGSRPIGIDISEAMVARARRRFGARAKILRASIEALPLPNSSVDKAASVNNLYFWPDPEAGLAELARVLRPGGLLAIAFEPPEELAKWPGSRFGFRAFSEDELRRLLDGGGFGEIRAVWGSGRKPDRFLCLTARRLGEDAGT
jgi:SAM-dependent methyltransferase